MKILGLDVGEKRIGVARADSTTRIAVPVGFISVNGSEWGEIDRLAKLNNTNLFVLGLPRSNEGNETKQSQYVKAFAKKLLEQIPEARIRFQDESLTSVMAEERLKKRKKKYEKGEIDEEAACIILQDFLESLDTNQISLQTHSSVAKGPKKDSASHQKTEGKHGKKKSKKLLRWITIISVIVILGLLATGIALYIREKRYEEYARKFREIEEQMIAETFDFTITPGETIMDVKKRLAEKGYGNEEIEEAMKPENYKYDFLEGLDSLEGYLFGETHNFYETATVKDIISTYLEGMKKVISENNLKAKYEERGLSLRDGIILASIVQKEAYSADQPIVAQVFLSRLAYGWRLGSDVTVTYALNLIDPERTTYTDNQSALQIDSCYNTRIYAGLPCGAISNPGLSALLAVANPSDTAYLYFLTGDDGMMYYGYTEAEHFQNIRNHCQVLCNVSL